MAKMRTVLVTGGCGFIGSNFIDMLLRDGREIKVVNVDKLTYAGRSENVAKWKNDERFVMRHGDIAHRGDMSDVFDQHSPNVVVNFAAESHVDMSIESSAPFVRTNIEGTAVLMDSARAVGVDLFVQVSTDEVYGSLGFDDPAFTESSPYAPNSPYSASKASADLLVLSYVETHKFPAIITRCSNNYGPMQCLEKFVPLFITNLLGGEDVPLYGDGSNVRDWIHVDDHCRAILSVIESGEVGEVYNIGGDAEWSNLEVAKALVSELCQKEGSIVQVTDRPGHDLRYAMNHDKLTRDTGWTPVENFEDGLYLTILWYEENVSWWKNWIENSPSAAWQKCQRLIVEAKAKESEG